MSEEWYDIPGRDGYKITRTGLVKRMAFETRHRSGGVCRIKERILRMNLDTNGYPYYSMMGTTVNVHRLLAITFIPNPEELEQVNHKNGIKTDIDLDNLEWCTPTQNLQHRCWVLGHNLGEKCPMAKFNTSEVLEMRNAWANGESQVSIAKRYNTYQSTVQKIVNRISWAHVA